MHNEEKVEAAKKDAGGDEKLIIKFAWPYNGLSFLERVLLFSEGFFIRVACDDVS